VNELLKQDWSPEQISGRLQKEQGIRISHEWIYQQVLLDKQAGGTVYKHLRCQKKRRKRYGTYDRRGQLPNCRSIEERPAIVNSRKRLGDWEVDTMLGSKHKDIMAALTERKSRFRAGWQGERENGSSSSIANLHSPVTHQRQGLCQA
jgi:IS30 family transposase